MSISWFNKRYRTPDVEAQRINDLLRKQALERAQQERPTSEKVGDGVSLESYCNFRDTFKPKLWDIADFNNFKFPLEPDGKLLLAGCDFNAGVQVDDAAMRGTIFNIYGTPRKVTGLDDGGILYAPLDLNFNRRNKQYLRIRDNANLRLKEKMESPPAGMDGFTWIFRLSPLNLDPVNDMYLLYKWDNNSLTYGIQIKIKPNGSLHFLVRRNGTTRGKFANNPFTLLPPPAGNYYAGNYLEENYLIVGANQVLPEDHLLFFQYRFSDNDMRIFKGLTDITAGNSSELMYEPMVLAEPPAPPSTTPTEINIIASRVANEGTPPAPPSFGNDGMGTKKIYPDKAGGPSWTNNWSVGGARTIVRTGTAGDGYPDPSDPRFEMLGVGNAEVDISGTGILKVRMNDPGLTGSPRVMVFANPKSMTTWKNVESTVYFRVPNGQEPYTNIDIRPKTDHYNPPVDSDTNFGGYIVGLDYPDQSTHFKREKSHAIGYTPRLASADIDANTNVWIGIKGICYTLPNGDVKLEVWYDFTDGAGGGTWTKYTEAVDNGTFSGSGGGMPVFPNAHSSSAIRTNIGIGGGYVEYKKWTLREIDPSAIEQPTGVGMAVESPHVKGNMFDENLSTYWRHTNQTSWVIVDIGGPQRVAAIRVAWAFGNTRRYGYEVFTSERDDLNSITKVWNWKQWSALTTAKQTYTFPRERYTRYIGMIIYGHQLPTPPPPPPTPSQGPTPIWINLQTIAATINSTTSQDGHPAAHAIDASSGNFPDGNLNTRWASEGKGAWVEIDLRTTMVVRRIGIAWYKANMRKYRYKVEVTLDRIRYTRMYPDNGDYYIQSDIQGADKEYDDVPFAFPINARWIKITVQGNTTNTWASIWGIKVRGQTNPTQPGPGGGSTGSLAEVAVAEFDVMGFPGTTTIEPFVQVYNLANTSPNTSEYFIKLHAPEVGTEFVQVYSCANHTDTNKPLGTAKDRKVRGEVCDEVGNCPFFGEKLTRISCYVRRVGSPDLDFVAGIRNRADTPNKFRVEFGKMSASSLPTTFTEVFFTKTNNNYSMGVGDIVAFWYAAGDENNYVELQASLPEPIPDCHLVFARNGSLEWEPVRESDLDGHYYVGATVQGVSTVMAAVQICTINSLIYQQIPTKITFYLRRYGSPAGNITFKLLSDNNQVLYTYGTVAASSITTSTSALTAVTIDAHTTINVPTLVNYKIAIEYSGGNVSNYIMVKINNNPTFNDCLTTKSSNDVWSQDMTKNISGTIWKGGRIIVEGGGPIPSTPPPADNYSHDMTLFGALEWNTKTGLFVLGPQHFYDGNANRFRMYGKYLTSQERGNFNANKVSISSISFGKVYTPLTFKTLESFVAGESQAAFSSSFSPSAFNTGV
jgi:F5/8 type C domain